MTSFSSLNALTCGKALLGEGAGRTAIATRQHRAGHRQLVLATGPKKTLERGLVESVQALRKQCGDLATTPCGSGAIHCVDGSEC